MDENNGLNSSLLGDITYEPQKPRVPSNGVDPRLAHAETPVLDDFNVPNTYQRPTPPPAPNGVDPRLAGASAPLLDDMGGNTPPPPKPATRYQELTDEQVAILQQQRAAAGQPPFTAEEIAGLKAEFIERQRLAAQQQALAQQAAAQQQAQASIILEEASYTAPEKKPAHEPLPQVDASALLEEPAPEPVRRPAFNQEDIEAAKKQAAKRQAESLTSQDNAPDPAKSREQLRQLRYQQQADLAIAGQKVSIIATVIGVISGICMFLFSLQPYADDVEMNGFYNFAGGFYKYVGLILVFLSFTIVLRVQAVKGLTSFLFLASSLLLLVPGIITLLMRKGADGFGLTIVYFIIAIIGCFVVTFMLSVSDKLKAFYGRKEVFYD